jgi:predicted Zn-dependent peptidase
MTMTRREALLGLFAGSIAAQVPTAVRAAPFTPVLALNNGLRVHFAPKNSGYISAALVLRSKHIAEPRGLAHIMEHTSFTGAAGSMTAKEVKTLHSDCIQDGNASTGNGMIQWSASFLPRNTAQVLEFLATTSLDQRFDVETVASEARVVQQELYLDKYDAEGRAKKQYNLALFGSSHPYARDTTDTEITAARMPASQLAAELTQYARLLKLPANMDLFLVGEFEPEQVAGLVRKAFGRFDFAEGPMLDLPLVGATRNYKALSATSNELTRPLSENRIAWSTGVRITDPQAGVLFALGQYLNKVLFNELREKFGDTYSPEASFKADNCSGTFEIKIQSSNSPEAVERRLFETLATLKTSVDEKELQRFGDKLELNRLKDAQSNDDMLECMLDRTLHGGSSHDFQVSSITAEDIKAAARRFLPAHKGAYVRLAMIGQ